MDDLFWEFTLPSYVKVGKKRFSLNLNQYRTAHYQRLNKAKRKFGQEFFDSHGYNSGAPLTSAKLTYTIFFRDNRIADVMNVGAVVEKFATDCLVKCNYITDDNRKVVREVVFRDGGIDRQNPRVELVVEAFEPQKILTRDKGLWFEDNIDQDWAPDE